jgi:DUF4097 and DUF4098 domain-containing protein YvlB
MHTFDTPGPVQLRASLGAGDLDIQARDTAETTVELSPANDHGARHDVLAAATVEQRGNEILIDVPARSSGAFGRSPEIGVSVLVPSGSDLMLRTRSADIAATGTFGEASVETGSGDVRLGTFTGDVRLRAGSGDLAVDEVRGSLRAESGSGDINVDEVAGAATVTSGSGDISIDRVGGEAKLSSGSGDIVVEDAVSGLSVNSASGDVQVLGVRQGRVRANTASGDVHVGVLGGVSAWLDVTTVSGDMHSSLERIEQPGDEEGTVQLHISTVTGDITLVRT